MVSIRDVAEAAKVSVSTVSLVLNNKGNISQETRDRIMSTVAEMGYTPNSRAKNLRDNQSRVIGYAWDKRRSEFNPVLDAFLYALLRDAEINGRNLLLFSTESSENIGVYQELVASKRVDGFILSHTGQDDPRFAYLMKANVPFVAFGRSNSALDDDAYWVDVDGQAGTYDATSHLIGMGHQRIAFVGWPVGSVSGGDRYNGYSHALFDARLDEDERLLARVENNVADGYRAAEKLFRQKRTPTAIVCVSDVIAAGVARYLHEYQIQVALTGFDNTPIAEFMHPTLTSVQQPVTEAAEVIIKLLISQLEGIDLRTRNYLLKPELIVRESSSVFPG
jgi:DNA-binding LacI/PurR family transcriptional regulator